METRDATRRAASCTTALFIKLDDECDQQVTVVGRLSTVLGRVHRYPVLSTTDRQSSFVYHTRRPWMCRRKFFKAQSLEQNSRGKFLYFWRYRRGACSMPKSSLIRAVVSIHYRCVTDRQTDTHRDTERNAGLYSKYGRSYDDA